MENPGRLTGVFFLLCLTSMNKCVVVRFDFNWSYYQGGKFLCIHAIHKIITLNYNNTTENKLDHDNAMNDFVTNKTIQKDIIR